ncbi:DUF3703 domain-containing protein [Roseateles sp. LYH14W]|uniref:DUF3703 domain-containing protein n=1 Tax=Pelomonas parva TaxID=3299032 RepID=A0ABW7F8F6_9BURK
MLIEGPAVTHFSRHIAPHVDAEIAESRRLEASGAVAASFTHLERAHVLGQASTVQHVRVHLQMLAWSLRHRVWKELRGQVLRVIGAATKTALGWVPTGNTGGADISPFQPLPVPPDLARVIASARCPHGTPRDGS